MSLKKILLTISAGFSLVFFMSCNNGSSSGKTGQQQPPADTAMTPSDVNVPADTSAANETEKCFESDGLKYKLTIKIKRAGDVVTGGSVTSEEYDSGKKETVSFTGKGNATGITVVFNGTAPAAGAASEWTDKAWVLDTKDGKETLRIIFNAKNYDTNKWEETTYEFTPCRR